MFHHPSGSWQPQPQTGPRWVIAVGDVLASTFLWPAGADLVGVFLGIFSEAMEMVWNKFSLPADESTYIILYIYIYIIYVLLDMVAFLPAGYVGILLFQDPDDYHWEHVLLDTFCCLPVAKIIHGCDFVRLTGTGSTGRSHLHWDAATPTAILKHPLVAQTVSLANMCFCLSDLVSPDYALGTLVHHWYLCVDVMFKLNLDLLAAFDLSSLFLFLQWAMCFLKSPLL